MWARRLGLPHLWPSRVKVLFLGVFTSLANLSIFQYLNNANVAYLNLALPTKREIVCKLPRDECASAEDPATCTVDLEDRKFWRGLNLTAPCPVLPESVRGQTCHNPWLPLPALSGDLGTLHTVNTGVHPFRLWSILFLILTSLLSFSIVIHDLALIDEEQRPFILSIPNMKYATPCLWDCLTCVRGRRRMRRIWSRNRCIFTVMVMIWSFFQTVAFMAVMYPYSLLVCIVAPVKMSRIMVFLSSVLCALWSIVFVFSSLLDDHSYSVLWGVREVKTGTSCLCLCEFPLNRAVVWRIIILGTGVCFHSINLILRALKGLRRAQWANMFSVLYSVPIEAFPVIWERPQEAGGGPVCWRQAGEAVQSEPAFDPFCLMDEQPESAWTRAIIAPVAVKDDQRLTVWEPYLGTLDMEIGWCGFPRPVGGAWDKEEADSDDGVIEPDNRQMQPEVLEPPASPATSSQVLGDSPPAEVGGVQLRKPKKRPPPMHVLQKEMELAETADVDESGPLQHSPTSDDGLCERNPLTPSAWALGHRPSSSSNAHSYCRRLSAANDVFLSVRAGRGYSFTPPTSTNTSPNASTAPTLFGRHISPQARGRALTEDSRVDLSHLLAPSSSHALPEKPRTPEHAQNSEKLKTEPFLAV